MPAMQYLGPEAASPLSAKSGSNLYAGSQRERNV